MLVAAALSLAYASPASKVAVLSEGEGDAAAPNRTEALVQWADQCMQVVPAGLDMTKDCFNLAIAGSGSRTIYELAKHEGWKRSFHNHMYSVPYEMAKTPAPRCFVVQLREPAARLESYFKDSQIFAPHGQNNRNSVDELFEKDMLPTSPPNLGSRVFPVHWYFRNYSGVVGRVKKKGEPREQINTDSYNIFHSILWGAATAYNDRQEEMQVRGIDTSAIIIDEDEAAPDTVDAPLIDCVERQIVVGFLCAETLVPDFMAFVNSTKTGKSLTPPAGLQVGINPVINESKYPEPASKFILSPKNRQLWNDVFNFDDMTLYRHFCLGDVDESLVQQNDDIGGQGTHHVGNPSV